MKKKVIIITDGDNIARKTVETAAQNIGGSCISASAGNPTLLSGETIVELIKTARAEPVLVMLDDKGYCGKGPGEKVLEYIVNHRELEVLGVVAVASNTSRARGIPVDKSITLDGKLVDGPVNKEGYPEPMGHKKLEGDTVEILKELKVPAVIGIGDIGKMEGRDNYKRGARITTQAVKYLMQRSGFRE